MLSGKRKKKAMREINMMEEQTKFVKEDYAKFMTKINNMRHLQTGILRMNCWDTATVLNLKAVL